jgi:ubiquinone biosynthesis protein
MRLALQELGGAWVKLGQMLAMRFDLLPAAYCDELFKLLNAVQPFPYEQVSEIVRAELGAPPETIFRSFSKASFAAASIGQVHRAELPTGELVAVKVQRPGIREALLADIRLMYAMSGLLDRIHLFGVARSRDVIDEFARWTADELDYLIEARQAVVLHDHAEGDPREKIPAVYREYTTTRVLTTEFIQGIPVIEIMYALREGNTAYVEALEARGYDLDAVVRHLDWNMLNQVYVYGYFHADLHPANLFVLPGNVIGYVDFGIVGRLSERMRESLTRYSWLLFRGEFDDAVGELMRWLAPTNATDADSARRQLVRVHETFLYDAGPAARNDPSPDESETAGTHNPYSRLAVDIMTIIREHQLTLSQSLVAYLKMLVTLGTLRHELATDYDLPVTARRFFGGLFRRQALAWLDPRDAMDRLYAGSIRVQRAIEFVEYIEGQEPVITAGVDALFGIRARVRRARRRVTMLGLSILIVGAGLYFVLADPDDARRMLPADVPYPLVHYGLLVVLVFLILSLISNVRTFGRVD